MIQMTKGKFLFHVLPMVISLWVFFAACTTTKVSVHPPNSAVELSDYRTFDFFELKTEGDTSSNFNLNIANLKSEIIDEMNRRGLKQSAKDPELNINLGILIEEKKQTRQTNLSDPGEWNYLGQRNYKWESKTIEVGTYQEGSVTLHLVDDGTNEAVWVGVMEGILPKNPVKREKTIKKAVEALFNKIDRARE